MKKTFAGEKFTGILITGTLSSMVEYAGLLADNLIAGRMLGGEALAALGLINPFYTLMVFVAFLTAIGSNLLICRAVGKADAEQVTRIYSQGLILTVAAGLALTAVYCGLSFILPELLHVTGPTATFASEYFRFISIFPVVQGVSAYLFSVIMNQGGETLCTIGGLLQVVSNIGLSVLLCDKIGMQGISLASVLSNVLLIAVLCLYFLRPHHILRFKPYFSAALIPEMLRYSISDALVYLHLGLMEFLLNLFLVTRFGERYLMIFAVLCNLIALLNTGFDGLGEGIGALISTYYAENNRLGIRKTMKAAGIAAVVGGVAVMTLLLLFAPQIPAWFGLTDREIIACCVFAIRAYAPAALLFSIIMLMTSYYIYIDCVLLSVSLTAIYLLLMPVAMGVLGGLGGQIEGVWVGMALSVPLSAALGTAIVLRLRKGRSFPLYLDSTQPICQFGYDELLTSAGVMRAVDSAERDLTAQGLDRHTVLRCMHLIEETGTLSIARNHNKHPLFEVTITVENDALSLVLRDSGSYSDATDENARVGSVQEYAAMEIIARQKSREYFLTNGYNRTFYQVPFAVDNDCS